MAVRQAKDIPVSRRISDGNGTLMPDWERHLELSAEHLKLMEQGVDDMTELAPSATLAQVITQLNTLLAVLQRALR